MTLEEDKCQNDSVRFRLSSRTGLPSKRGSVFSLFSTRGFGKVLIGGNNFLLPEVGVRQGSSVEPRDSLPAVLKGDIPAAQQSTSFKQKLNNSLGLSV